MGSRPDSGPAPQQPPDDPIHCRDPTEDQEELPSQDTQSPAENDQPTHDVPVLDCDEAELEAMVAELNEDPNADPDATETPAGGQQRGGFFTVPKLLAILFGLVTTFTTTNAQRLAIPNGTSASPARPELPFYRMYDGSHVTCEEDGNATTTWTLILLLGTVVATLLIRTQHLEHLVGDPLRKEPPARAVPLAVQAPARLEANLADVAARLHRLKEHAVAPLAEAVSLLATRVLHVESLVGGPQEEKPSAPTTPAGPLTPAQPGVDLADLAARLQQLEEKAAVPTTVPSQPSATCPLASPTLPFFQATRVRVEAPGSRIDYLDPNDYWAYEMAVQQGEDSICQWFIHEILHPTLAGSPVTWEGTGLGARSLAETDTMLKDRFKFRIYRSRRGQDYDLLVYENDRIYVPRRGRYALIQAAHAAAHQGFGSTRGLLEKSFYWPYMSHDARRYVDACRAARAVRPRPGQETCPELFPAAPPSPTIAMDPVARTVQTVPDWDGPRGAEKIQVELRRVPTPEEL